MVYFQRLTAFIACGTGQDGCANFAKWFVQIGGAHFVARRKIGFAKFAQWLCKIGFAKFVQWLCKIGLAISTMLM